MHVALHRICLFHQREAELRATFRRICNLDGYSWLRRFRWFFTLVFVVFFILLALRGGLSGLPRVHWVIISTHARLVLLGFLCGSGRRCLFGLDLANDLSLPKYQI